MLQHRVRPLVATAGLVLVVAGVAACGDDDGATTSNGSSIKSTAPSNSETGSPSPSADPTNVSRGAADKNNDADVVVKVAWKNGAPEPASTNVSVSPADRVEVLVSADSHQDITVTGHPDDAADVDPDEAEDVDFVAGQGATEVKIGQTTLVTFTSG